MNTFSAVDSCRICGNRELIPVLSLGEQYLTGVFPRTRNAPITRGPLDLIRCDSREDGCGLVQLKHSYNSREMYGDNYGYRSSLNTSMVAHLRSKVEHLQQIASPQDGELVIDIGSNDGTTLSFYPENLERAGIDPTAAKFGGFYKPGIHVIPDFFSAGLIDTAFGGKKVKIVTSIAMLYDLDRPLDFANQVASILDDTGIWHFEQSYMPLMLATTGYDTICHEHVEYYALAQIDWMMQRAGLRILEVVLNDVNGGSFGVTVCRADSAFVGDEAEVARIREAETTHGFESMAPFERFAERVQAHRVELIALLDRLLDENAIVLGYGASTKGNVILQYCGIGPERIPCIAEVNEEKFGAFTPGTNIPIVPEAVAHAMKPDYFLAMPWHFRGNLLKREAAFLASGGKMIFPLPALEIVGS